MDEADDGGRRDTLVDGALGLVVTAVVAVAITADVGGDRGPDLVAYLFAGCLGALMLVRRRFPVLALMATGIGVMAYHAADYPPIGLAIPVAAALYSVAEAGRLRVAVPTALAMLVVSTVTRALDGESLAYLVGFEMASNVGLLVAAIALGDGMRTRRLLRAEQRALTRRAAAERELEARRRVESERVRIARDLHDVLAHTVAVVSVQTDVATETLDDDPPAARAALSTIRRATDDAVRELRSTIGLLRRADERDSRAPTGGLRHLDSLITSTVDSGLPVTVRVDGEPVPLPAVVDTTAYRIVQESLTNALRHADADRAELVLSYRPDRLLIRVSDDGRGGKPQPSTVDGGQGIAGMAERARLLGGWVRAAPMPGGGFRVEASLPLDVTS